MTLRGQAAIVGIGEIPTRRTYPGRSVYGLSAEAARLAIQDAGLRKEDIDGLVVDGAGVSPTAMADYINMQPNYASGVTMMGATGCAAVAVASAAIVSGMCHTALVILASARTGEPPPPGAAVGGGTSQAHIANEWEAPFGLAAGANTGYGMMKLRHMHEYGTKPEQFAKIAVDQRFNALANPNAAFQGQPITIQDVLNSRYINYPLHMLETVMPCAGGGAVIVTSAERAKAISNRPVYVLGAGMEQGAGTWWGKPRLTVAPAKVSAARALRMAGYAPKDMQFAEFYD